MLSINADFHPYIFYLVFILKYELKQKFFLNVLFKPIAMSAENRSVLS